MRGRRRSEDHLLHLPPALASFPKLLRPGNIAPPLAGVAPASLAWASGNIAPPLAGVAPASLAWASGNIAPPWQGWHLLPWHGPLGTSVSFVGPLQPGLEPLHLNHPR